MFGKAIVRGLLAVAMVFVANAAVADTFGTGANQFTIEFVPISSSTNPTNGIPAGDGFSFTGVANDYRMGTYEITNDQWNKFETAYGTVRGHQSWFTNTNVPVDSVTWYEAAQFVNWLNTSAGSQAAYNFSGSTFAAWSPTDTGYDAGNPYRNKAAKYFLPTENEWVKAAYWHSTVLQDYAAKASESLTQGTGSRTGWSYWVKDSAANPYGPWNVGSGSEELNGTYDMMGNAYEWVESPYTVGDNGAQSTRASRGGAWYSGAPRLTSSLRGGGLPNDEDYGIGFRVASVPEPGSLAMLAVVALTASLCWWRKRA